MAKRFSFTDKILIGVAFIDKILDETWGAGGRAYRAGKLGPWTPPGYKGSALQQSIYRLLRTGNLEKVIEKGEPVLKITRGGRKKLARRFSFFELRKKDWDGYWRLVIFDISEKKKILRERLRRKLKELNFGQWQKSIYISPYDLEEDMREFLDTWGLTGMAYVLTAKHKLLGDARVLARQIWPLDKINEAYYEILDGLDKVVSLDKLYQRFLEILEQDPCLPRELLPENWAGENARVKLTNAFMQRSQHGSENLANGKR